MLDFTDPRYAAAIAAVIAAVIAAAASVVTMLMTHRRARQTAERIATMQREQSLELERLRGEHNTVLEMMKARLGEEKDERAARRDYEYDARKRLYEQCDPLLFQFVELSENALGRITNLAKACQDGSVRSDGSGWLDHRGYYFLTTLYRLMVPCVVFELLQRRLTLLDLRLDSRISTQFALCRMLYLTFRNDWDLAAAAPPLAYQPDDANANALRSEQPAVYCRQGIYAGHLDLAVDALIVSAPGQASRFLRYGEFAAAHQAAESELSRAFAPVASLFFGFHPDTRPVLWRILVAQAYIYRAIRLSGKLDATFADARDAVHAAIADAPAHWLDYAAPGATAPPIGGNPVDAALAYLKAAAGRPGVATA